MVIRAKDQASRIINSIATSATADFSRISREARLQGSRLGLDMANMRMKYDRAILQSRERLTAAQMIGDKAEMRAARERIQRLQLIRDANALNIRQQQLAIRTADLEAKTQQAARQRVLEHNREMARTAGMWIAVGATMALVGGAGVVALHRMAMGAVEYQRQAALTMTQVHNQATSVKELQDISTSVAASVGVPLQRMQVALYDIFSSTDVSVKESKAILMDFAKAAVAGQVDIQVAGRATIAFMNAFKDENYSVNRLLDIQFKAVQLGTMTYAEFASTVGRAIPAVKAADQSIEFLAGTAAFLTRNGQSAAMAMTAIARGSEMFLRKPVQSNLRAMGIEALNASGKLRPINEILTEMAPHFLSLDSMAKKRLFEKIFGGQNFAQARRFFDLAIRDTGGLKRFIDDVTNSSGAFTTAYLQMAETVAAKTQILKNNWMILSNSLGEAVMPRLNDLIIVGIKILGWLNGLSDGQKKAIANTLLFGSVAVALVGTVVAIASTIVLLAAGYRELAAAMTWASTSQAGFAVGLRGLAVLGPIGVTVAAIAGGMYYLAKNTDTSSAAIERNALGLGRAASSARLTQLHLEALDKEAVKNYAAFSASEKAAERLAERGITPLANKVAGYTDTLDRNINTLIDWNNLTDDQKKIVDDLRKSVEQAIPAFGGYHERQDKIRDATERLREAQHDLAVAQQKSNDALAVSPGALERVHDATVSVERAQLALGDKTKDSRLEHIRLREAQHDLARAQDAAKGSDENTVGRREQIRDATKRVREAEEALREARGLTAAQLNKNLREEVAAYKNWADNTQILIKRGVDPKFVQMLSIKGPEYVAAYVKGVDKQAREGARLWEQREKQKERVTRTQAAIMLGDVGSMALGVSNKLRSIKDERVGITAVFGYKTPPKLSIHDIVGATGGYVTPFGIVSRSLGGPVWGAGTATSDSIPAFLSNGEFVVNARSTARHRELLHAINAQGLAGGGAVLPTFRRSGPPLMQAIGPGLDKTKDQAHDVLWQAAKQFQSAVNQFGQTLLGAGSGRVQGVRVAHNAVRAIVLDVFANMFGWSSPAMIAATDQLLMHESGYNNLAQNPTSTAFGVFQFLNSTWAGTGIGKTSDPRQQAIAGGRYISSRYGSPIGAWSFWQAHHWYHQGGRIHEDIVGVGRSGRTYGFQAGETVVPRDGGSAVVNIYGPVYGANADELAAQIEDALDKRAHRNGFRSTSAYLQRRR